MDVSNIEGSPTLSPATPLTALGMRHTMHITPGPGPYSRARSLHTDRTVGPVEGSPPSSPPASQAHAVNPHVFIHEGIGNTGIPAIITYKVTASGHQCVVSPLARPLPPRAPFRVANHSTSYVTTDPDTQNVPAQTPGRQLTWRNERKVRPTKVLQLPQRQACGVPRCFPPSSPCRTVPQIIPKARVIMKPP